jgi:hypothetical protein
MAKYHEIPRGKIPCKNKGKQRREDPGKVEGEIGDGATERQ